MRMLRILAPAFGALLLGVTCNPVAEADAFNKKTVVTFDQDVEIPGWTLPAGTYVFKLTRSISDLNTVQVFDQSETHLYATLQTASEETLVTPDRAYFTPDDRDNAEGLAPSSKAGSLPATIEAGLSSIPRIGGAHSSTARP